MVSYGCTSGCICLPVYLSECICPPVYLSGVYPTVGVPQGVYIPLLVYLRVCLRWVYLSGVSKVGYLSGVLKTVIPGLEC